VVVNQYSTFDLRRGELTVTTPVENDTILEATIKYVDHHGIRERAREIAALFVAEFSKELFPGICGRCGNCCRTFTITANALEIMRITRFLNMSSEDEFREKFTLPASTWNEKDGIFKRVNDHCIFLDRLSAGKFGCTIYPVRPSFCSAYPPNLELCKKSPGKLIYYLENIRIKGDSARISTTFQNSLEIKIENPALAKAVNRLKTKASEIDADAVDKLVNIAGEADKILDGLQREFFNGGVTENLSQRIKGIEEIVADLECLTALPTKDPEAMKELKRKSQRIRDLMEGKARPPLPCGEERENTYQRPATDDSPIKGIRFLEDSFMVLGISRGEIFHRTMHYRDNEEMLRMVRELLYALITHDDPVLQDALKQKEPECFLCGECCRQYPVEISPFDIERIGEFYALTEEEVWEKFLEKGKYTWNPKNGIFKRVVNDRDRRDCIFLRKKFEGIYHCSIYEVRPQTCREYATTSPLCRKTSLQQKCHTHMSTIISIDIIGDVIYIITHYTASTALMPVAIPLKGAMKLSTICKAIKRKILDIMAPVIVSEKSP
jgi:Fe-S-cluster containining protein